MNTSMDQKLGFEFRQLFPHVKWLALTAATGIAVSMVVHLYNEAARNQAARDVLAYTVNSLQILEIVVPESLTLNGHTDHVTWDSIVENQSKGRDIDSVSDKYFRPSHKIDLSNNQGVKQWHITFVFQDQTTCEHLINATKKYSQQYFERTENHPRLYWGDKLRFEGNNCQPSNNGYQVAFYLPLGAWRSPHVKDQALVS